MGESEQDVRLKMKREVGSDQKRKTQNPCRKAAERRRSGRVAPLEVLLHAHVAS